MQQPQVAGLNGGPTGGGSKQWIIMAILGVLIIGGIIFLSMMKKDEEVDDTAKAEAKAEAARNYKPEKRPAVATDERPFKKEMARVSVTEFDELTSNVKKWVYLKGKVKSSSKDGLIVFERALGQRYPFEAQLVRGVAPEVEGKEITVIGWMIDTGHLQIDGPEDVDVELPEADLAPGYEFYSVNDYELLKGKVGTRLIVQGKVEKVRYSTDEKYIYLVFDAGENDVIAAGLISHLETGMTLEALKEYEGKMVSVRGLLDEKKWDDNHRLIVNYGRFRHLVATE